MVARVIPRTDMGLSDSYRPNWSGLEARGAQGFGPSAPLSARTYPELVTSCHVKRPCILSSYSFCDRARVHVAIHLSRSFSNMIRSVAILLSLHFHCHCFAEDLRRANIMFVEQYRIIIYIDYHSYLCIV